MNERREFTRILRPLEVDVVGAGDGELRGVTHDVSMKGLLVSASARCENGTDVRCTVYLDGRHGTARIVAIGNIVRQTPESIAIAFRALAGLESLEHLQQLLRLNAGAELEQVEREIAEHVGLLPR